MKTNQMGRDPKGDGDFGMKTYHFAKLSHLKALWTSILGIPRNRCKTRLYARAPPAPHLSGSTDIRRHYTRHPSCNKANAYGPKVQKWHKAKISKFAAAKTPFYRHASGRVFAAMLRQQSPQKERRVVWQGQYAILKPNIPAMKLHAP